MINAPRHAIIYGGSFDPPHYGHLKTACAVQQYFQVEQFIFIPCKFPLLKARSLATDEQRLHMLELALEPYSNFRIDTREMKRDSPSYTINTLESFRNEWGENTSIILLIGMDAFKQLPQWHQWKKILEKSHILVIKRTHVEENIPVELQSLLNSRKARRKEELLNTSNGKIFFYDAGEYDISSTWLRQQIKKGQNVTACLPQTVMDYIRNQSLYQ